MGSSKQSARRLYDLAARQQGFFTARQAKAAGYRDSVHPYHLRNGDWERVHRGVYRLVQFPEAPWPELVLWWLWSRGRDDQPKGVYSHETARAIHGDTPRRGRKLHMTVPPDFRRGLPIPGHLVLHPGTLRKRDILYRNGFAVTTPARTRQDLSPARPQAKPAVAAPAPEEPPPVTAPVVAPRDGWAAWE